MKLAFYAKEFVFSLIFNCIFVILSSVAIAFALMPGAHPIVIILGLLGVVVICTIYFVPSITAFDLGYVNDDLKGQKHPYRWIILLLNFFLAATGIVWIIIYIWAYTPGTPSVPASMKSPSLETSLVELEALLNKGLITNEEYLRKRASLLS